MTYNSVLKKTNKHPSLIPPSHRTCVLTSSLRRPSSQGGRHRRQRDAVRTQEVAVRTPKIAQNASPRRPL
ncbi:hypothetical protein DPMN_136211 [Dreissena polymorpha]|uniref:Uncharacterized protein n=1 Tax=Dreissena polymorpha TaxID=45954 RepID=A0A9D4FZA0_DREPO|nr:hypothetical protein DPMN_136211 [Dreissena polymorpha]